MKKILSFLLIIVLVLLILPRNSVHAISVNEYCMDGEELKFISLINEYRKANNLSQLKATKTLGAAADHHSLDMAKYDYVSHYLYDGTSWSTNMTQHNYPTNTFRGENIAAGRALASENLELWKGSPAHNDNMLNSNYYAIGIGRAYNANGNYKWYWTTVFGNLVDTPTPPTCIGVATPTPPPPTPTTAPVNYVRLPYSLKELSSGTTVNQWKNTLIYIKKNMNLNQIGFYNTGSNTKFEIRSSDSTGSIGSLVNSGNLKLSASSANYYYQDISVNLNSGIYYLIRVYPTSGRYYYGSTSTYYTELSFLRRSNGENKAKTTGSFQYRLRFTLR